MLFRSLESPESPEIDSVDTRDQDQDPVLTNALMCLCVLVVMQDTSCLTLYESPIMHYLAVHSVDEQS